MSFSFCCHDSLLKGYLTARKLNLATCPVYGVHHTSLNNRQIQVQRAGRKGFAHNEINPNAARTRILQIWALPPRSTENAEYKIYEVGRNKFVNIYGGASEQTETFDSPTEIKVGIFAKQKILKLDEKCMLYLATGKALVNGVELKKGSLLSADSLELKVLSNESHITVIS